MSHPSSQQFSRFPDLPPEIRHQIWLAAVPSPGINFFNIHVIPNDHRGANRSISVPLMRLDLRRLEINHHDEQVATYDPSVWQARDALCRTCREARLVCAIPARKAAQVILTRPRRGLFIRARDGQLRSLTPLTDPRRRLSLTPGDNSAAEATGKQQRQPQELEPEPLVHRTIRVHIDDIFCLSIENCSFNLPYEESPALWAASDSDDDSDLGWVYDPQFNPPLPSSIPTHRYCINLARSSRLTFSAIQDVITELVTQTPSVSHLPAPQNPDPAHLVMLDAVPQDPGERTLEELNPAFAAAQDKNKDIAMAFRDRYGDRYAPLPWDSPDLQARFRLTKLWPEVTDIREQYLRSSLPRSPKRPRRFMSSDMG
ncbi:hypothetical protein F4810DRAFT_518421 [Camillea tinctor]|nr:hypothetical protein F4810DRAFT_518421 [Camillea tinctor]